MKKFFVLWVFFNVLFFGQVMAGDTNVWMEITPGQYSGTNYIAVTVYYPTNFINWRLETSTDLAGNFWRGLAPADTISVEVSPYGVIPRWKKYYLRPTNIGPAFFRAIGNIS